MSWRGDVSLRHRGLNLNIDAYFGVSYIVENSCNSWLTSRKCSVCLRVNNSIGFRNDPRKCLRAKIVAPYLLMLYHYINSSQCSVSRPPVSQLTGLWVRLQAADVHNYYRHLLLLLCPKVTRQWRHWFYRPNVRMVEGWFDLGISVRVSSLRQHITGCHGKHNCPCTMFNPVISHTALDETSTSK